MDIEANGLEKLDKSTTSFKDWNRKYQRDWSRNTTELKIRPVKTKLLKNYYNEYVTTAQRDLYIPVNFNDFVIQFAEIGFLQWREKHKGK